MKTMFRKQLLFKVLFISPLILNTLISFAYAQDSVYTKYIINSLTAEFMGGRGYAYKGDKRAADFIRYEFKHDSLIPFTEKYYQPFSFPVNTFPKAMSVIVDGQKILYPGKDFIVDPASSSAQGNYELIWIHDTLLNVDTTTINKKVVVLDKSLFKSDESKKRMHEWSQSSHGAAGIIILEEKKLTWSVSQEQNNFFAFTVLKDKFDSNAKRVAVDIDAKFVKQHKTQNIVGLVKGEIADTFLVFTAHYDHLGWMGKYMYFPGANDNASGTSMMMNLAKYYSQPVRKPKYSMLFIAFAGEEAGLMGSKYYTENPLKPLSQIKFLINMDLMGTGDEGMMVVNATEFTEQYKTLSKINDKKKYLSTIGKRGKAANSDHYWFTEKGVPAFFFYTMGGIKAYHDIYDRPETLPLTKYSEVFHLITDFVATF